MFFSDHCRIKTETYIPVDPITIQVKCLNPPMTSFEKFDFNRSDWINLSQSLKFTNWIHELDQVSPEAPNDTAYKRWSCHSGFKLLCKLCRTSPPPAMGARFTVFWACRPCGPAGWLALLLTKAGDVETNPGPTTLNKKVWICDICHK